VEAVVVLIPSPLNGPLVWAPVSRALRARGIQTLVANLEDDRGDSAPFWAQHAASVARKLAHLGPEQRVILAGHSGAGPLLPAISAFSPHPVDGYLFVDAGLPIPGQSHLQELETTLPEFGAELRRRLEAGRQFPEWTDEEVREILPDEGLRHGILAQLHPRGKAFFTQPFPSFENWPDAPCGYIRFSAAYDEPAAQARAQGWAYREFQAGHFHMVVDPEAVAAALADLIQQWPGEHSP
jgi:pimeloyl-ACP methyl ester carboxylesterase